MGGNRNKLDVTLIDAFRIKELNLLIVSYLFRQTHNSFIKGNPNYAGSDKIDDVYYSIGAIVGVISTGILVDAVIKNKNFLTIFILNIVLFLWDIYLFIEVGNGKTGHKENIVFSIFLGLILASADLIYLVLIPFLIAKQQSEKMAQLSQYQRVCFAGTIVGVVLALSEVGKYLFSNNVATFLNYVTSAN